MRQNKRALAAIIGLALLALPSLAGGQAKAQTGQQTSWTRLGTLPRNSTSIAFDPSNPAIVYAVGPEGISKSTNSGKDWTICSREALSMRVVVPQAAGEPLLIYATTPTGLRESSDGCATWKDTPFQGLLPSSAHVRWISPYPNNQQVLYAGMDGLGGLYRSTDGGAGWQPASKGLPPGSFVTALTADPTTPERIFAAVRNVRRGLFPAPVFRSADGGLTWKSASLGITMLPNNGGSVIGLGWSGGKLLAATSSDGLFASTDHGDSWQQANLPRRADTPTSSVRRDEPPAKPLPLRISAFHVDRQGVTVINTPDGPFQSVDGAQTWRTFGPGAGIMKHSLLALDPATGRVLFGGSEALWGYTIPAGLAALPTSTPAVVAQVPPTPPPPPILPTATPVPPTATQTALPTPTIAVATGPLPTDRAQPGDPAVSDFFPQTGHNISHGFRAYWKENGDVGVFGYPLTDEFVENGVTVQYFERVRLEYRDNKIVWGLLGSELTKDQFFRTVRFFPSEENNVYFGPTQHSVSGPFLEYWRDNGGLETFGYPLSESFVEERIEYQWFERARFEWHLDNSEGNQFMLSQLGKLSLEKRGWIR